MKLTPTPALALAAAAATVIAVGTVAAVTPSGGRDPRAGVSGATAPGDSTTGTGGAGSPTAAYSSPGSASSSSFTSTGATTGSQNAAQGRQQPSGTAVSGPTTQTAPPSKTGSQPPGTVPTTRPTTPAGTGSGLDDPAKKEIAMELVSSAENSSLNWRAQYKYIEDINDGRGYTGGIIGFCSGTGDMLDVVQRYTALEPGNILAKYLGALKSDNGSTSHSGLDPDFTKDWVQAAADPRFQQAQNDERDAEYFNPAVDQAKADGLGTLGQFIYYDAMVMHGPGSDPQSFGGIRAAALLKAKPPSRGGDQIAYLNAFLDARIVAMKADPSHQDTSRIDTEQRLFVKAGNVNLDAPLHWWTYGDAYTIG